MLGAEAETLKVKNILFVVLTAADLKEDVSEKECSESEKVRRRGGNSSVSSDQTEG